MFGAQATLRGMAVELPLLLMFWLSKDTATPPGAEPRTALAKLPEVRQALETQLADRSPDGRVPRAIMGRFLSFLLYFGEDWLKDHIRQLVPADDHDLRQATWRAPSWS